MYELEFATCIAIVNCAVLVRQVLVVAVLLIDVVFGLSHFLNLNLLLLQNNGL